MKFLGSLAFVLGAFASTAGAVTIPGLVNTGAGFTVGTVDTNYQFTNIDGTAAGTGGHGVVAADTSFPFPYWIVNSNDSKWLTPSSDPGESFDPSSDGHYMWRLSFDLSGFNSTTASFTGRFLVDNLASIKLNGVSLGLDQGWYSHWTNFGASSGFQAGVNTLDFIVTNLKGLGNPTGLRVEFTSSNVAAIPLPPSAILLLSGAALLLRRGRRMA